jgi:SAM-dependent methyltransferase
MIESTLRRIRAAVSDWGRGPAARQTVCWGTLGDAARLGAQAGTRSWAHAWIRAHMEQMPIGKLAVVDAGSGMSNPLLDWYRPRARHVYLVEFLATPGTSGNTTVLRADLEDGLPLPDEAADIVTSASSIEHLSHEGQLRFLTEAQRILRPGGAVVMTVSYIFGLDDRALSILSRDPALIRTGCTIKARLDLRAMLAAAPRLACPGEPRWELFPGFDGFDEHTILSHDDVIFDRVGSYADVRCLPETDSLGLKWAEIGLYLVKRQA